MLNPRKRAVRRVLRAWLDKGPHPDLHVREQVRLRREWPALARALDLLANEYKEA